jgi:hypothetical protein
MSSNARTLTPALLRKIVLEERAKLMEVLETGKEHPEDVTPDETDADGYAGTLEKDIDHYKALKIHEARLRRQLGKISEAKSRLGRKIRRNA